MDFSRQDLYDFFCYYCNDDKFFKKLRSEIEKRDSVIESLADRVDNVKKELETSRPIIDNLSRENELLRSHIGRLSQHNENLTNDIERNSQEKEQLTNNIERLSQHNEQLTNHIERNSQEKEQLTNHNEGLSQHNQNLINDIERLRQEIDQLRTPAPEQERSSDSDTKSLSLVGMEIRKNTFQVSLGSCHEDISDEKLSCLVNIEKMRAGGTVESLKKNDLKKLLKYWEQPIMRTEEELRAAVREMMKKKPKIQRIFIGDAFTRRPIFTRQTTENSTNQPESTEIYFQCGMPRRNKWSFVIVSLKKSSRVNGVNPNAPHTSSDLSYSP